MKRRVSTSGTQRVCAMRAADAAARMLESRYGTAQPSMPHTFGLAWFQEDAVQRAAAILERRGGVLISDSVGLGKTYIALALIEEHLGPGRMIAVATPAALRWPWHQPLMRLARSRRDEGGWIGWVSHARLSRSGPPASWPAVLDLIVVDEAHAFRNIRTRRYRELARLCRGARVVLLTATPVNNTVLDLFAQLRLFAGNGAFQDLGVADLRTLFAGAALSPGSPPPELRAVLGAVLIRRTRPLVRELLVTTPVAHSHAALRFPARAPPVALRYDLESAYPGFYDAVTEAIEGLSFSAWRAGPRGHRRARSGGAAELMRLVLLKRLESSVAAFSASIGAQIRYLEAFLDHLGSGRWLTPADDRALRSGDGAGTQLLLAAVVLPEPPTWLDIEDVAAGATADLELLRALHARLDRDAPEDPKLGRLRELLHGALAGERVLLFSEFRETARWLWQSLRDTGGVALIDGGGAFLGRARASRRQVIDRFAPLANGAPEPPLRERVRLLIATDVLAEGLNLQDARHVVSFDLPWNPVRLIQRVGRIDRLGSPHQMVQAHAFLPERGLEQLLGLLSRVQQKLAAIHATAGAEAEDATFLERIASGDATVLDEIERRDAAPFEAEERLRLAWAARQRSRRHRADTGTQLQADSPRRGHHWHTAAEADARSKSAVPVGVVLRPYEGRRTADHALAGNAARTADVDESVNGDVVLAAVCSGETRFVRVDAAGEVSVDDPLALQIVALALTSPVGTDECDSGIRLPWKDADALPTAHEIEKVRIACVTAADRLGGQRDSRSAGMAPRGPPENAVAPGRVCVAAARELMAALARIRGGPPSELCTRAEQVLELLRHGVAAGAEQALDLVLRSAANAGADALALVHNIEDAVSPRVHRPPARHGITGTGACHPERDLDPVASAEGWKIAEQRSGGAGLRVVAALVVRATEQDDGPD